MSTWSNSVRNTMNLKEPTVHEPSEVLAAQFGPEAESLLRELGSALSVLIGAVERIALDEFAENDPMSLKQAQEAHLRYLRAANEYVEDHRPPDPYRNRTEFSDSPTALMNRVWAEISKHEGSDPKITSWYLGTMVHGSDPRSAIVLGAFGTVTGPADGHPADGEDKPTLVLVTWGDSEMDERSYRVTIHTGDDAKFWRHDRRLGGGFWDESRAGEFTDCPL